MVDMGSLMTALKDVCFVKFGVHFTVKCDSGNLEAMGDFNS